MLERLRNAFRSGAEEKPILRKTTEVRLETEDPRTVIERAHAHEPALIMLEGDLPGSVFRLRVGRQISGNALQPHVVARLELRQLVVRHRAPGRDRICVVHRHRMNCIGGTRLGVEQEHVKDDA